MKRSDSLYNHRIQHVIEAIENINKIVENINKDEFKNNIIVNSALCYQFLIIGEAISALPNDFLEKYDYPWYKPRSFRNFLAHEYFGVDMNIVFDTIRTDLPELRIFLDTIKKEIKKP